MLRTLTDLITWTSTNNKNEWKTWEEWQRHQPPAHYEKSDLFQYYLACRVNFQPPPNSCVYDNNRDYYIYCFGDFAPLLVHPRENVNIIEYLVLLLDVYDTCKGISRRLIGDPAGITILRNVVLKRSLNVLDRYNFSQHMYPYTVIHAHTVAQYSLSTILMTLVSHYINYHNLAGHRDAIDVFACQKAYNGCVFGAPEEPIATISQPIAIRQPPVKQEETHSFSWPLDPASFSRCKLCKRVCERLWGNFSACIDCHSKRICLECGAPAVIISTDNLPRCTKHQ